MTYFFLIDEYVYVICAYILTYWISLSMAVCDRNGKVERGIVNHCDSKIEALIGSKYFDDRTA